MKIPKSNQKKVIRSWDDIMLVTNRLINQIEKSKRMFNSIYGIPRGGLVVAVLLSHRLNIPVVDSKGINPATLIVDDICDGGETLQEVEYLFKTKYNSEMTSAVLYQRRSTMYEADFVGEVLAHDYIWIVFPWELR